MTKTEFLEKLAFELNHHKVADASEIVEEYEQHFTFKLADGYSEEEIAAKLGDPVGIAEQYDTVTADTKPRGKALTRIGIGIADFFFCILCTLLYAWEIVMTAFVIACAGIASILIANVKLAALSFIPYMPYHCAIILGIAFAALTILSLTGTVYFFGFIRQLTRSYIRFRKNKLSTVSGHGVLPSVSAYPKFSAKIKRLLRWSSLFAATIFAVCFITGFIACVISAGSVEFWHIWGWFGYHG